MSSFSIVGIVEVGDKSLPFIESESAEGELSQVVSLPKGYSGIVASRTDTGCVLTIPGHGILNNDNVDLYWTGGLAMYGDAAVAGGVITITGLSGDVVPANGTAVIVSKMVQISVDFDGDDLVALAMHCSKRSSILFVGPDVSVELTNATTYWYVSKWNFAKGGSVNTNPLTGAAVTSMFASVADINDTRELVLGILYDSVP